MPISGRASETAVPPVVAPPPGHPRFPFYDSLRGIAALMVVTMHTMMGAQAMGAPLSSFVSQFELSITILFMLSAFLLYRPFVAARMGKGRPVAIRDYAFRRALRILPGYWVALVVLAIYPGLQGVFTGDWWVYFGLLQDYHPLYEPDVLFCAAPNEPCGPNSPWSVIELTGGILPAWTLGVEVTFYAVLPLFVLAFGWLSTRVRHPLRLELGLLAVLSAASVLTRYYALDHIQTWIWVLKTLPTIFLWLATGMVLAIVSAQLQGREQTSRFVMSVTRRPWLPWVAAIALYCLLVVVLLPTPDLYGQTLAGGVFKYVALTVIALLLLLPATFGDHAGGWPRRVLANRFIAWIGLIAYGLYLYHLPIMVKLNELGIGDIQDPFLRWVVLTIATFAVAIPCGAASYYLVERWFLRLKYRGRKTTRAAPRPAPEEVVARLPT